MVKAAGTGRRGAPRHQEPEQQEPPPSGPEDAGPQRGRRNDGQDEPQNHLENALQPAGQRRKGQGRIDPGRADLHSTNLRPTNLRPASLPPADPPAEGLGTAALGAGPREDFGGKGRDEAPRQAGRQGPAPWHKDAAPPPRHERARPEEAGPDVPRAAARPPQEIAPKAASGMAAPPRTAQPLPRRAPSPEAAGPALPAARQRLGGAQSPKYITPQINKENDAPPQTRMAPQTRAASTGTALIAEARASGAAPSRAPGAAPEAQDAPLARGAVCTVGGRARKGDPDDPRRPASDQTAEPPVPPAAAAGQGAPGDRPANPGQARPNARAADRPQAEGGPLAETRPQAADRQNAKVEDRPQAAESSMARLPAARAKPQRATAAAQVKAAKGKAAKDAAKAEVARSAPNSPPDSPPDSLPDSRTAGPRATASKAASKTAPRSGAPSEKSPAGSGGPAALARAARARAMAAPPGPRPRGAGPLWGSQPFGLQRPVSPHGQVTAVSMMKDEGPFVIEWVAHHLALGFTDLVVYTNDCSDGTDEMLIRLEELGLAHHRRNVIPPGLRPQPSALNHAEAEPVVRLSDWIMVFDADEFLSIRHGDGGLDGLLAAVKDRDANGLVVTWRIFGSGGVERWSTAPVTEQYLQAAPPDWNKGWGVKTLFQYDPEVWKLGIHRPKLKTKVLKTAIPDQIRWLNGSGLPMEEYFKFRGWRSITRTVGYDWVQLNHYAVKSVESYALRKLRGNVNNKADKYNSDYWALQDRNETRDETMLRYARRRGALIAALLADPVLAGLHQAALARVAARLDAIRPTPEFAALRESLARASQVPIGEIIAKPPQARDPAKIAALMSDLERLRSAEARAARKGPKEGPKEGLAAGSKSRAENAPAPARRGADARSEAAPRTGLKPAAMAPGEASAALARLTSDRGNPAAKGPARAVLEAAGPPLPGLYAAAPPSGLYAAASSPGLYAPPGLRRIAAPAREDLAWVENHGIALPLDPGLFSAASLGLIAKGKFERGLARLLPQLAPRGGPVLEFGAGCGFLGLHLARQRPDLPLLLREEDPALAQALHRVMARNAFVPGPQLDVSGPRPEGSAPAAIPAAIPTAIFPAITPGRPGGPPGDMPLSGAAARLLALLHQHRPQSLLLGAPGSADWGTALLGALAPAARPALLLLHARAWEETEETAEAAAAAGTAPGQRAAAPPDRDPNRASDRDQGPVQGPAAPPAPPRAVVAARLGARLAPWGYAAVERNLPHALLFTRAPVAPASAG